LLLKKALLHGGDFADLYFEHTLRNWLILEDGKVNQSYGQIKLGVGIRTVKNDQVGYGYTEELNKESMLSAAATAASLVNETETYVKNKFEKLKSNNYYPLLTSFEEIPLSHKLPLVKSINEKCFGKSNLIVKVNAGFHDSMKRVMVVTSDGIKTEDLIPRNYLYASTVAEKNGKREQSFLNVL
jgi:TldD protein